jgi:diadenosine tetraphosphate (Ap4A) HIT family hydrolase
MTITKSKEDCIFCKIVAKKLPCAKVWEDEKYLAILDISPNVEGMTLVIPKEHYDSYAFEMPSDVYGEFLQAARKVAKLLDEKLKVQRTAMVMEGLGINHAHIKLYPIYGLESKFQELWAKDKVFFEKYPGYISTQLGPSKSMQELQALAKHIRGEK